MDGGRNTPTQTNKVGGIALGHSHNGRLAQQTAKRNLFAHALARHGDKAHGRGLGVDDADGHFVSNDARDGRGRRVTGNGDHGWYEGFANCRYNGEEIKFCVDPSFLVDVLKVLKKCTISDTSLLFEGDGFHHLVALVA